MKQLPPKIARQYHNLKETPVANCSVAAAATAIKTVSFSVGWVEPVSTASRERCLLAR